MRSVFSVSITIISSGNDFLKAILYFSICIFSFNKLILSFSTLIFLLFNFFVLVFSYLQQPLYHQCNRDSSSRYCNHFQYRDFFFSENSKGRMLQNLTVYHQVWHPFLPKNWILSLHVQCCPYNAYSFLVNYAIWKYKLLSYIVTMANQIIFYIVPKILFVYCMT